MRRHRTTARFAAVSLGLTCTFVLAGCGAEAPLGAAPADRAVGDPAPLADPWLLPDPAPEDVFFEGDRKAGSAGDARLTVYGEPESEDPAAGPMLAAHFEPGNEREVRLPCHREGFEDITVQGAPGRAGWLDDRYWVCWKDTRTPDEPEMSPNEFAVIGREVSENVVRSAAEAATVDDDNRVTIPAEARPEGLQQLAQGPISLVNWGVPDKSREFTWSHRHDQRQITLYVSEGEEADGLLARVALGGTPTTIRGAVATEAASAGDIPTYAATWWEDGRVVVVTAMGVQRPAIDGFVESLTPASDEDLERLRSTIVEYPPAALLAQGETLALAGHNEHAVWAVGYDGTLSWVHGLLANGGGFSGSTAPGPEIGDLVVTVGTVELGSGEFFAGYAHPDVARTVLVTKDGTEIELPLADSVTEDGGRYFGTYLHGKAWQEVLAYDADGVLLERFEHDL